MKTLKILQVFLLALVLCCPNILAQTPYTSRTPCPVQGYDANAVFDWTQDYYPFYITGLGYHPMPSPWVDYPNNFNLGDFQYTGRANYAPEYGWVLVKKDFGTLGFPIQHPYIVLYNKFRGTLRIFVAITSQEGTAQKAVFKVWFPGEPNNKTPYKSGIFEFNRAGNSLNALDRFDNQIPFMKTSNWYAHALPYWVYTDIATAYDPCTCNYSAKFAFDVELINTTSLQFTANGNIVQQIDSTGAGGGGRQNLLQTLSGAVAAGTSYHSTATNGISTISSIFNAPASSFIKNTIPGLAAAAGAIDFLSGAFGITTPPQPIAFKMDLQATGSLVTSSPHKQQNTDVPGTEHVGRPLIPIYYDNVMGVYNLLETPKLTYYKNNYAYGNGVTNYRYPCEARIAEPIKYILNPNAEINLDKFDIYGAIELEIQYLNPNSLPFNLSFTTPNLFKVKDIEDNKQVWRSTTYPLGALKDVMVGFAEQGIPSHKVYITRSFVRITIKHKRKINALDEMEEIHIGRFLLQDNRIQDNSVPHESVLPVFNPVNRVELQEMRDNYELDALFTIPAGTTQTLYAAHSLRIRHLYITGGGTLRIITGTPSDTDDNFPNVSFMYPNDVDQFINQIEFVVGVPDLIKGLLPPVTENPLINPRVKPITNFCNSRDYISRAKTIAQKGDDLAVAASHSVDNLKTNLNIYPNPATDKITFKYDIATKGFVKIVVSNALGIIVAEIVQNEIHEIGSFESVLDTNNLNSGVYIASLETAQGRQTQKIVVVK